MFLQFTSFLFGVILLFRVTFVADFSGLDLDVCLDKGGGDLLNVGRGDTAPLYGSQGTNLASLAFLTACG